MSQEYKLKEKSIRWTKLTGAKRREKYQHDVKFGKN
jgi:hypothetical protein